jgi:hypothetical protein
MQCLSCEEKLEKEKAFWNPFNFNELFCDWKCFEKKYKDIFKNNGIYDERVLDRVPPRPSGLYITNAEFTSLSQSEQNRLKHEAYSNLGNPKESFR